MKTQIINQAIWEGLAPRIIDAIKREMKKDNGVKFMWRSTGAEMSNDDASCFLYAAMAPVLQMTEIMNV